MELPANETLPKKRTCEFVAGKVSCPTIVGVGSELKLLEPPRDIQRREVIREVGCFGDGCVSSETEPLELLYLADGM
jgi:hypothetical protein